jgi:hypothetical protein
VLSLASPGTAFALPYQQENSGARRRITSGTAILLERRYAEPVDDGKLGVKNRKSLCRFVRARVDFEISLRKKGI